MIGHSLLDLILAPGGLRPVFQPIYRLRGAARVLHGLECLIRGPIAGSAIGWCQC